MYLVDEEYKPPPVAMKIISWNWVPWFLSPRPSLRLGDVRYSKDSSTTLRWGFLQEVRPVVYVFYGGKMWRYGFIFVQHMTSKLRLKIMKEGKGSNLPSFTSTQTRRAEWRLGICSGSLGWVLSGHGYTWGTSMRSYFPMKSEGVWSELIDNKGILELFNGMWSIVLRIYICEHRTKFVSTDCVCGDRRWMEQFPTTHVTHILVAWLDHATIVLSFDSGQDGVMGGHKPQFRFEVVWP
ncbi:UNVERIFIED_CONTAM: hypothetical protein Slati_2975200 [Sesamum latifolium]|uniref:Uncharacterized protein n=1 Tax=Sesamum latifolium TaxID=2727402 RepID=A0AAW2VE14_9LAMI